MKSFHFHWAVGFLAVANLAAPAAHGQANAEMEALLGSGSMQAAPPRPGDEKLTCAQIAKETHSIMRARKIQLGANGTPNTNCNQVSQTTTTMGAPTGTMLSQLGGVMRAMNDPRLLRLALLAQEKSCAEQESDPTLSDGCDSAPQPDPFMSGNPSRGKTLSPAPSQPAKSKPTNSKPAAPTDPFQPR